MIHVEVAGVDPVDGAWTVTATSGSVIRHRKVWPISDDAGRVWPSAVASTDPHDHQAGSELARIEEDLVFSAPIEEAVLAKYGSHLFAALFDAGDWDELVEAEGAGGDVIGLALELLDPALQACVWEAMHDGTSFLALRPVRPVVPIRLVEGSAELQQVERQPRILFALGVGPQERDLRSGAEVMGVIDGFERGAIARGLRSKTLEDASLDSIALAVERWRPDVVHLIGHGTAGRDDGEAAGPRFWLQRPGEGAQTEVTGAELAKALEPKPALVLVSACQTGRAASELGTPIAARLVELGVPIAIAMGGDIHDSACRTFTRSLAWVVGRGRPMLDALAVGRRAAMDGGPATRGDWALPAVFASRLIQPSYRLVDDDAGAHVRTQLAKLDGESEPVFVARHHLLARAADLVHPAHPLAVVALNSEREDRGENLRCGGSRLLLELAAAAIREGQCVVRVGPFANESDAPKDLAELVVEVLAAAARLCRSHGVSVNLKAQQAALGFDPTRPLKVDLAEAAEQDVGDLIDRLRRYLASLPATLAPVSHGVVREDASTLLLFDDVHDYPMAFREVGAALCGGGLGEGATKVPVAFFAKGVGDTDPVPALRGAVGSPDWLVEERLGLTRDLAQEVERLAFLHWLLLPARKLVKPPVPSLVPLPHARTAIGADGVETWHREMRRLTERARWFYDPRSMQDAERYGLEDAWLGIAEDEEQLARLGMEIDE